MTTQQASGGLVCVNTNCAVAGYPTIRSVCVTCGQPTRKMDEPGLHVPPVRAQGPSQLETVNKGVELGSRAIYGGFWVIVALVAGIAGFALLANAEARGLLVIGVGVLAGLYARYILTGGRFRIMFW